MSIASGLSSSNRVKTVEGRARNSAISSGQTAEIPQTLVGIARFDEEVRRAASGMQKTVTADTNNCGITHSGMEQVNEMNYGSSKNYQDMNILMNQRRLNSVMATDQDYERGSEVLEIPSNKNRLPTSYYSKAGGGRGGPTDTMRSGGSTQKDSSQFLATSAMYD